MNIQSQAPVVVGLKVTEAMTILQDTGFDVIDQRLTTPPWNGKGSGDLRVVRQKSISDNRIELVVAYEDYQKDNLQGRK